ncbi:MAG: GNAT family N-acetyltransferase [Pseudomonadota bacterium]
MKTRLALPADTPAIKRVVNETNLFPADMLGDLIAPFFSDPGCDERWFVVEADEVLGFAYVRPEPLADGTWNVLAIGVRKDNQGQGLGRSLMATVEAALSDQRVLIVETSGLPEFARTRQFYLGLDYTLGATLRAYWGPGDDKVVFWKALGDQPDR